MIPRTSPNRRDPYDPPDEPCEVDDGERVDSTHETRSVAWARATELRAMGASAVTRQLTQQQIDQMA